MEDEEIIRLYHARDEGAIGATAQKYGPFCLRMANNILGQPEDAEECVNDTWMAAWQTMPPQRPNSLRAFLGRIVRNLSISRFRRSRAGKRDCAMEVLLSDLDDCLPDSQTLEQAVDYALLGQTISGWLSTLPREDGDLFVRRYWYGDRVNDLAKELGRTPNQVSQRLLWLRKSLKAVLEKGDFL